MIEHTLSRGTYLGSSCRTWHVGDLTLTESWYPPGAELQPHAHASPHLCVVLDGDYTEAYGRRTESRAAGEVIFLPCDVAHAERHLSAGRHFLVEWNECLARAVEIVEKQRFDAVLAARIFRIAGMADAHSDPAHDLLPRRATSYRLGVNNGRVGVANEPYKHLSFLTGAGSVYATAHDLLRFRLATRSGRLPTPSPTPTRTQEWDGVVGRTSGYEAFFDSLDAAGLTFIFLSNLQSTANWQIQEQVRNVLQNKPLRQLVLPPPVGTAIEPTHLLVGRYGSSDAAVEITLDDGHLFRGENEFYATDKGDYYSPASSTTMQFRRGSDGRIDAIISVGGSGQKSVLPRLADAKQPAPRH